MAGKESKELVKKEGILHMLPFSDWDRRIEEIMRNPLSLLKDPLMRASITEDVTPWVEIFEDKGDVVVKAELPGIKKEDLDITLTEDTITIAGEKKEEEETKKKDYYRWECSYGSFCRSFTLLSAVQTNKVKTKMKDGVLEVRIPKTEEAKKKEVKVKVE